MSQELAEKIVDAILSDKQPEGVNVDWTRGFGSLSARRERKEEATSVGHKIAAFATSAEGWLVIGIEDQTRQVVGAGEPQIVVSKVGEVLRECKPIPPLGNPFFMERKGRKIAAYLIPWLGGTICRYKDEPYHRVQDSAKKMTYDDLVQHINKYEQVEWEQRSNPANRTDIDQEELEFYLQKVRERGPLETTTTDNFLINYHAISGDRKHLTNLGVVVLAKKPSTHLPQCKIQLVRFRGISPTDRLAAFLCEAPARKAIIACINFLKLNLPVRERFEGASRIEEPVVPEKVLREAVVNMVVHRDYGDPQESLIRIFDDRVEFQNPGAPSLEDFQKIMAQSIPIHRNQWMYNFLRPVHQADAAGQGIGQMRKELSLVSLPEPKIVPLSSVFHLTISLIPSSRNSIEDRVLAICREKKTLTTTDVMEKIELSRPAMIRILNNLVQKGLLTHEGKRRGSRYSLAT